MDTEVEMKEIYTSNHMWKLFENFLVDICRVMEAVLGFFLNPNELFWCKVPKSTNLLLASVPLHCLIVCVSRVVIHYLWYDLRFIFMIAKHLHLLFGA